MVMLVKTQILLAGLNSRAEIACRHCRVQSKWYAGLYELLKLDLKVLLELLQANGWPHNVIEIVLIRATLVSCSI